MTHTTLYEKLKATSGLKITDAKDLQRDYSKEVIKQYKLMIKTHWDSGMNYLCITKKKNFVEYKGSGKAWGNLIKARPSVILTSLLFSSDDLEEFDRECVYYSLLFDVVNNPAFSNLIPEFGYQGNVNNFQLYFETASENTLKELYSRRAASLKLNHHFRKETFPDEYAEMIDKISKSNKLRFVDEERANEIIKKISEANSLNWQIELRQFLETDENNTVDMFNRMKMEPAWKAVSEKYHSMTEEEKAEYCLNKSIGMKLFWDNMEDEDRKKFGEKVSAGRLNMSDEAKKLRADRITESFKNSEKRISFNASMKVNRIGGGNPFARIVHWYDKIFHTRQEFDKFAKSEGLTKNFIAKILKDDTNTECYIENPFKKEYIILVCPHCNKEGKNSSAFKRFHLKNCKQNPNKGN
jgi:hypothetical protein